METAAQPRTAHAQTEPQASVKDGVRRKLIAFYGTNKTTLINEKVRRYNENTDTQINVKELRQIACV